jgi:glycosyltransferase involved in cell wall biosynthesis
MTRETKRKVLLIVYSNLKHDARMLRHVNFLKDEYALTVACFEAEQNQGYRVIQLPYAKLTLVKKAISALLLLLRFFPLACRILYPYHSLKEKIKGEYFDLIIANDAETLPLAFDLAGKGSKVFFDAHEYAPRHFENVLTWRLFFQPLNIYLCKKYIPLTAGMITVGRKIAEEYDKHFGVKPEVVTNAPARQYFKPHPTGEKIRLVHHGIGTPSRKIEVMIELMKHLPDYYTLDLILITPPSASANTVSYLDSLKSLASFTDRITFVPPVNASEILRLINQYDIGIISIPPVNFNYENTLPNKFFDCIQARLALAIGPTPEMAEIVREYKLGVVANDFSAKALAEQLNPLTRKQIDEFKQNCEVASQEFCAENNKTILLGLTEKILAD